MSSDSGCLAAHVGPLRAFEEEQLVLLDWTAYGIAELIARVYAFGKPVDDIIIGIRGVGGKPVEFKRRTVKFVGT